MKLGLSEKEARVYLALLELAKDTAINIAAKAKMPRATVYVMLDKLIHSGLASQVTESGKTFFIAEDPHELDRLITTQINELEQRRTSLSDSIQQLIALYNRQQDKPAVRYYEGEEGLIALDSYRLNTGAVNDKSEVYAFSNFDALEDIFPNRRKKSVDDRVNRGVKSNVIYSRKEGPIPPKENKKLLREGCWVPESYMPFMGSVGVHPWGVKIYEFGGSKKRGILIEDDRIAEMVRSLFRLAWLGAEHINKNDARH